MGFLRSHTGAIGCIILILEATLFTSLIYTQTFHLYLSDTHMYMHSGPYVCTLLSCTDLYIPLTLNTRHQIEKDSCI